MESPLAFSESHSIKIRRPAVHLAKRKSFAALFSGVALGGASHSRLGVEMVETAAQQILAGARR